MDIDSVIGILKDPTVKAFIAPPKPRSIMKLNKENSRTKTKSIGKTLVNPIPEGKLNYEPVEGIEDEDEMESEQTISNNSKSFCNY